MNVACQTITGMQLCLISVLYKEKTAASCSVDRKAVLWIVRHGEIKGTIGQQVLSCHNIESSSVVQHKNELSCHSSRK